MNKADLITAIAEKAGMSHSDAEVIFSATFAMITEALVKQDKITIPGFGSFAIKIREERKGRNPRSGEELLIPKAIVPVFKAGTQLKDVVNVDKK